jgi:phytoene synthase
MELDIDASDLAACRAICKQFGTSYFFSTQLFPREIRQATYILYAFFRVPDEIVDTSLRQHPTRARQALVQWKDDWSRAYYEGFSAHPVLRAAAAVFHAYDIPFSYSKDFLRAMMQDCEVSSYATYAELREYMYGAAAVVGLMMSHVIGFNDARALDHAKQLGYAMQLTNFLRDIHEDCRDRGRVYMPLQELSRFGLSTGDIANQRYSPSFKGFMEFEIRRCRDLYAKAESGIRYLHPRGRFAVLVASRLYRAILDRIECQGCDPFAGRARTSMTRKLLLLSRLAWFAPHKE